MKYQNLIFLVILFFNISCQSKEYENAILISEVKSLETEISKNNSTEQPKLNFKDSSAIGEYGCFFEDIAIKIKLNNDYTYCLNKTGIINLIQEGTWSIRNNFIYLKRKTPRPFYRLLEIDSKQHPTLTVYDIESGNIIWCEFQTQTLWWSREKYSDSLTIIPRSTRQLTIKSLEYPSVRLKIKNLERKRIEVFLSRTESYYTQDSFRLYSGRLVIKDTQRIFNKLNE